MKNNSRGSVSYVGMTLFFLLGLLTTIYTFELKSSLSSLQKLTRVETKLNMCQNK